MTACLPVFAQSTESYSSSDLQGTLIGIALLWMIGHMIYVLFIHKSTLSPISIDDMKAARREAGKPEEMTADEIQECIRIHDENFATWTPVPDTDDLRVVTSKKMLDSAAEAMQRVKALKPTDTELVDAINANIDMLKDCEKRQFTGSKTILVLLVIFTCFMVYMAGWRALPFFLLSGVVYFMASLTPNFMIYNKELKGKSGTGALGWVLGLLSSMILGAQTVRTTTYWSDGSKTVDDDHTQHQVAWFISLFVTILLIFFLLVWAAVNYLRNYVLYK